MDIIEKLNKINVKELQNIDYQKLLANIKTRPDIIIIAIAVAGTIFFCSKIYGDNQTKITTARTEIKNLEKKIEAIEKYKKRQDDLQGFVTQIPGPISEDNLINLITDFAVKHHVQIESFSPANKGTMPLYETAGLNLNLSVKDYKNLWLFIHDIEESAYPIHIGRWRASLEGGQTQTERGQLPHQEEKLLVQIEIVSVNVKKE